MTIMKKLETLKKQEPHRTFGSLKRDNKKCKKNDMKPHVFMPVTVLKHVGWKGWIDFECVCCGKKDYIYDRKLF